ncbi:transcriptional regulator, partial [Melissococcus plutonius]
APTERLLITIATDRRLCNLERNRNITRKVLEESDDQTVVIIQELYLKQRPTFTLVGIAQKLYISKNTAYRLRNKFFEQMAEELEI